MLLAGFLVAGWLATLVFAQTAGSIEQVGTTLVSAMMMFLGNEEKVYILDKTEGNPATIGTHPAWGAVWDIATNKAITLEVESNSFCASGLHLPNGSYVAFGGNHAISPGPKDYNGPAGTVDPTYQDLDGRTSIRILAPCTGSSASFGDACQWFDNSTELHMQRARWYSTAEALGDGTVVLLGGMTGGGFINRRTPTLDPVAQNGSAENTYEYYPAKSGFTPAVVPFLVAAGGLNTYAHAMLMPSGKMFLQANLSTALWDPADNTEVALPDMPNNVVRVYPASGATAMMPLTPANNWTPTVLFCGGFDAFTDADWGNYSGPTRDPWTISSSSDCHRITPEPTDGSAPAYIQDDPLPIPRTMGQFVLIPDGTMLIINGGAKGMAAYANGTFNTPFNKMPYGWSLATEPVLTPVIYDPRKPAGSRFSSDGLGASKIPRLYHSSAMLLPDGSVLVAGSNPNGDYSPDAYYPTTYTAERFYPAYFNATRPVPSGIPSKLSYGGPYFNLTLPNSSYTGDAGDAASKTTVVLIRTGFTTHSLNMGQRFLQLNNTYSVEDDGTITLHVAQVPPNANLLTPGPALLFVVVDGVPSVGKMLIVGSGAVGRQPLLAVASLPEPSTPGGPTGETAAGDGASAPAATSTRKYIILGGAGVAAAVLLGLLVFCCMRRSKTDASAKPVARPNIYRIGTDEDAFAKGPHMAYATPRFADSNATLNGDYAYKAGGALPKPAGAYTTPRFADSNVTLNGGYAPPKPAGVYAKPRYADSNASLDGGYGQPLRAQHSASTLNVNHGYTQPLRPQHSTSTLNVSDGYYDSDYFKSQ